MSSSFECDELMRAMGALKTSLESFSAGKKDVNLAGDDGVLDGGVTGHLFFAQNGRKESHLPYSLGASVRYISRYSPTITQTGYRIGGYGISRVYHIYQITHRLFQLMLTTQFTIVREAFP
jgi:hypothetical protein